MAWERASLLGGLALALLVCVAADAQAPSPSIDAAAEYYFANLVTGATQWADPGDSPYVDDEGNRYWKDGSGQWAREDPNAWKYKWVERWSEEHSRPYFFNQHTKASIWNRPADLAWVRVQVTEANRHKAPPRPYVPSQQPRTALAAGLQPNATAGAA